MKKSPLIGIASVAVALLLGGSLLAAQERQPDNQSGPPPQQVSFEEAHTSLLRNNIFVRERRPWRPPTETPTSRPAPPPPVPEKDWRLVGVVFEEGVFRAYLENLRGEPVARISPGGAIAEGVITEVYIDAIRYQSDGQRIWVEIGQDLTGATPVVSRPPEDDDREDADDEASDSARDDRDDEREDDRRGEDGDRGRDEPNEGRPSAEGQDPSSLSIEERLRLRRQQESGR